MTELLRRIFLKQNYVTNLNLQWYNGSVVKDSSLTTRNDFSPLRLIFVLLWSQHKTLFLNNDWLEQYVVVKYVSP